MPTALLWVINTSNKKLADGNAHLVSYLFSYSTPVASRNCQLPRQTWASSFFFRTRVQRVTLLATSSVMELVKLTSPRGTEHGTSRMYSVCSRGLHLLKLTLSTSIRLRTDQYVIFHAKRYRCTTVFNPLKITWSSKTSSTHKYRR